MYALSIDQIADLLHFNGNNSYQTSVFIYFILLDHPFSMYAKLSEKLTFFISDDIHTYVRIRNVSFLEKFACVLKMDDLCSLPVLRDHSFTTYAKLSEKLTFRTPWYAHIRVRIRGLQMLVSQRISRAY